MIKKNYEKKEYYYFLIKIKIKLKKLNFFVLYIKVFKKRDLAKSKFGFNGSFLLLLNFL